METIINIEYENENGKNITRRVKSGLVTLFRSRMKANEFASKKQSYVYPVNFYKSISETFGGETKLINTNVEFYGFAVPK